ncbi:DUF4349 domain-containing protein [Microbacterium sp. 2FI]|uniref:DUF4349 domain-containing protein n=1 Tax=Microbacterium sp. 2FI TaxID=2502193 RepID=UPI0010F726AC|nr:DUF4349 domain-containing protein [Microbacterium sp. 2FI]
MSNQERESAEASLPELSAQRIDEIETALFADIASERRTATARRARRGRIWMAGGAAAAVIAIAAIIAPSVGGLVGGAGGSIAESADQPAMEPGVAPDMGDSDASVSSEESGATDGRADLGGDAGSTVDESTGDRDIITNASATVVVDDVAVAARTIGNAAIAHDGYVESMNVGTTGQVQPMDGGEGIAYDSMTYPYPYPPVDGAWITVRVPSDELPAVIDELSDVGEVTSSSINRQDVTQQTVDLEARIEAAQASVDRLTALLAEATNIADLIAAESALAERQAMLESYQQQLEMLDDQVAMSSLTVTLTPVVEPVEADPAGFTDGLAAGWNGLVATLNGIVIALGFLLPWLVVVGLAGLVVWAVVRWSRRRRAAKADAAASVPAPTSSSAPRDAD